MTKYISNYKLRAKSEIIPKREGREETEAEACCALSTQPVPLCLSAFKPHNTLARLVVITSILQK